MTIESSGVPGPGHNPLNIRHLSPSALKMWLTDREGWFLRYGCKHNSPTTRPMMIGTAFDARCKLGIYNCLGRPEEGAAVYEACIREVASDSSLVDIGEQLWDAYKQCGLVQLLTELSAGSRVLMEADLTRTIVRDGRSVTIKGKPDLHWYDADGILNVLDWKVNGYGKGISPNAGYWWDSRTGAAYRGAGQVTPLGSPDYMRQVATYGWLIPETLDAMRPMVGHIHQILWHPTRGLRVAWFRHTIDVAYQATLWDEYMGAWENIMDGRVFTDLTELEDVDRQVQLRDRGYGQDSTFDAMT